MARLTFVCHCLTGQDIIEELSFIIINLLNAKLNPSCKSQLAEFF